MLRTTNKQVTEALKAHVLDNFLPENYGNNATTIDNLRDQLESLILNRRDAAIYQTADAAIYQTALDYVEGGSYLVYYQDVQSYLKNLLQWQAGDPEYKAWRLYCHLIARTMSKLYTEGK